MNGTGDNRKRQEQRFEERTTRAEMGLVSVTERVIEIENLRKQREMEREKVRANREIGTTRYKDINR